MARKGKLKKQKANRDEVHRPERIRRYKYLFLIVCEDQKTEPEYFETYKKHIPEHTLYLKPVGAGLDPKGVVERAISERDNLKAESKKDVDSVWVVFDKDNADNSEANVKRFNEAFSISEKESFNIAYSNDSFELWLLIHFIEVDKTKPIGRHEIYEHLKQEFKKVKGYEDYEYDHYKVDPRTLEIVFKAGNREQAIERAKHLLEYHSQVKNSPINANPSTRVHLLVSDLLEWINFYSYSPK